jgi:geranylgeranyl pyrophosphate synthase
MEWRNKRESKMKKKPSMTPEQAMKYVRKIFKQRGTKALEMARKEILNEKIESKETCGALAYFMTKLWHDVSRPSLLALVCESVGGNPELTTPIAVSMTLISGAMDIHDDIIDQSEIKYGRPTVYGKYGKDIALLVGDALLFKGLTLLNKTVNTDIPSSKLRMIIDTVNNMFFELGDAEALELLFRGNLDVPPQQYLRVLRRKAGDVEAHTRVGAIIGGASWGQIEALGEYGRLLGMLIMLRDDWIDLFDVDESCRRIKNESLPLPLLFGLQHTEIKDKLRKILLKKNVTERDAETILETIQRTDVPKKFASLMNKLAARAIASLSNQNLNSENLEPIIKATLL